MKFLRSAIGRLSAMQQTEWFSYLGSFGDDFFTDD
jgi:hypothetical protein